MCLKWDVGVEVDVQDARQVGSDSKTNDVQPENKFNTNIC